MGDAIEHGFGSTLWTCMINECAMIYSAYVRKENRDHKMYFPDTSCICIKIDKEEEWQNKTSLYLQWRMKVCHRSSCCLRAHGF